MKLTKPILGVCILSAVFLMTIPTVIFSEEESSFSESILVLPSSLTDPLSEDEKITEAKPIFILWRDYPKMENLTDASTHIIQGYISDVKGFSDEKIPVTEFEVTVKDSFKGDLISGNKISYFQYGDVDSSKYFLKNDRISKIGEEFVLFLSDKNDDEDYFSVGGPQGQFLIKNSKVFSLDSIDSKVDWIHVKENAKSLTIFSNELKSTLEDKKE